MSSPILNPPLSLVLSKNKTYVIAHCTLHKVPDKFIKLEATATHLTLDTTSYPPKRYHAKLRYPEGAIIDANDTEGVLTGGHLKWKAKVIRFESEDGDDAPLLVGADGEITSAARKAVKKDKLAKKGESQKRKRPVEEKAAAAEPMDVSSDDSGENGAGGAPQSKKAKNDAKGGKKDKKDKKEKVRKVFPDKSASLELAEAAGAAEEDKERSALEAETARRNAIAAELAKKAERKARAKESKVTALKVINKELAQRSEPSGTPGAAKSGGAAAAASTPGSANGAATPSKRKSITWDDSKTNRELEAFREYTKKLNEEKRLAALALKSKKSPGRK